MSTSPHTISRTAARRLAIAHQGLHATAPFGKGKRGVYETISHLGYVQIDTISVAERAHNHILWSRVPNYQQKHLQDLQQRDRRVIEFWAHAAAFLPMKDYRYLIPTMDFFRNHHDPWPKSDQTTMRWVLDRIRNEGPLKSRDFEAPNNQQKTGWWDWKPAKLALQRLFFSGDIMVSHREGFQRVYDIADRVVPSHINTSSPSLDEYAEYLIHSTLRAHGIARLPEIHYLRRGMGTQVRKTLTELQETGSVIPLRVKGVDGTFFTTEENINKTLRIANTVHMLSPFDNAVIQRARLYDLFDFNYQIEVYVPKPKRKYGYYCLPVLYGDQFYGRVDVKADRAKHVLELIHVVLEDKRLPADFIQQFAKGCAAFAQMNKCHAIQVGRVTPANVGNDLKKAINELM